MNSQPGGWEPVLKETFEKMKTKAVGKSDACRNAWNICRFSRFSKSSQSRGEGKGAHRPVVTGAPGCLIRPGRALEEPQGRAADTVKPQGVCQRNQTPQRAESCIGSEWLARPRLLQIWPWTCERRIPRVPTLCRRSGRSHSQPGTMQVSCNQRVRGSRAAGMETPSRAREQALVWHSEMNCRRRHRCWQETIGKGHRVERRTLREPRTALPRGSQPRVLWLWGYFLGCLWPITLIQGPSWWCHITQPRWMPAKRILGGW